MSLDPAEFAKPLLIALEIWRDEAGAIDAHEANAKGPAPFLRCNARRLPLAGVGRGYEGKGARKERPPVHHSIT